MRFYVLLVTCLGLAAAGCRGAADQPSAPVPVQKAVSASLQTGIDGSVRGPAASVLSNNAASIIGDNGAGLLSDNGAGLISLAKFRALAATTEAVAGAQVQVEDLHGHVLSASVPTDQAGHYHLSGSFGSRSVLAVRARYQREGVDVSLLSGQHVGCQEGRRDGALRRRRRGGPRPCGVGQGGAGGGRRRDRRGRGGRGGLAGRAHGARLRRGGGAGAHARPGRHGRWRVGLAGPHAGGRVAVAASER